MLKFLKPTWYSKNLIKINLDYLKQQGVNVLMFDLDNTLASYQEIKPDQSIIEFIKLSKNKGFKVFIISNNHQQARVKLFAELLGANDYIYATGKPKTSKIKVFISKNNLNSKEITIIGDQLLTDVLMANRLNVRSLLIEPRSKKDLPITWINRIIDNKIRAYFKNSKQLIDIGSDID